MTFAKLPTQAPQFDATALWNLLDILAVKAGLTPPTKDVIKWKRWVEATSEQDGKGLRDVVNANALALNAVKTDLDARQSEIAALAARVAAVEARPAVPFPGSGP